MATYSDYLAALKNPYRTISRLRFLNPDSSTAFVVGSNPVNKRSRAFIAEGNLVVNRQNGTRRTATVRLDNTDGAYEYDVNHTWFGTEIALDVGLVLPSGEEYYFPQGVFVVTTPESVLNPSGNSITYNLTDKWANLDGTLYGNLYATHLVDFGVDIFTQIRAILQYDRGNGLPIDNIAPVITNYYDGKTQVVDEQTVLITNASYTLRVDDGSYADVILGLTEMLNAWVGYDASGALRIDPSQDDILDTTKPIQYRFSMEETSFLGATYRAENTKVYNDYIVIGEALDGQAQPNARATNYDPASPTNVNIIGRKTYRESKNGYVTKTQCQDYVTWKLKRSAILQSSVDISCKPLFHIKENELVTIYRPDKQGNPTETHLVTGFTLPLVGTRPMTISAVSVTDFPIATITNWPA